MLKKHVLNLRNSLVILLHNLMHVFTQFHIISHKFYGNFTQFRLFLPFLGKFKHIGYQKTCTWPEKFISGIGIGHRPQEGPKAPKGANGSQKHYTGAIIKGAWAPLSSSITVLKLKLLNPKPNSKPPVWGEHYDYQDLFISTTLSLSICPLCTFAEEQDQRSQKVAHKRDNSVKM